MDYTHVIWDWNGTLLDDVSWCMQIENEMLADRGMKRIESMEWYRNSFCFPVREYYRKMGYDFTQESYEALSAEFIRRYHAGDAENCPLHRDAGAVLAAIHRAGITQVILSASEAGNLRLQTGRFGIERYFDEILGIGNILAGSKADIGIAYKKRAKPARAVMIGDTAHDAEVAKGMGVDCILVAAGHQNRAILEGCGVPVLAGLAELPPLLGIMAQSPQRKKS